MSSYWFYAIVALMALTLILSLLALFCYAANSAGGDSKNKYRANILGGLAYVLLALLGEIAIKLSGQMNWLLALLAAAFLVIGGLMIQSGFKRRSSSR